MRLLRWCLVSGEIVKKRSSHCFCDPACFNQKPNIELFPTQTLNNSFYFFGITLFDDVFTICVGAGDDDFVFGSLVKICIFKPG